MHKRNPDKLQARKIRRIIMKGSFHEKEKAEFINMMTRVDVMEELHEPVMVHHVPDVEIGEILKNLRGEGTLQHDER